MDGLRVAVRGARPECAPVSARLHRVRISALAHVSLARCRRRVAGMLSRISLSLSGALQLICLPLHGASPHARLRCHSCAALRRDARSPESETETRNWNPQSEIRDPDTAGAQRRARKQANPEP